MSAQYHVLSGRRIVATKSGFSAREVALDYLRAMGCKRDEIIYYGTDGVSWRGAVYRARLVDPGVTHNSLTAGSSGRAAPTYRSVGSLSP